MRPWSWPGSDKDHPWIKAIAKCIVVTDVSYDIESDTHFLVLRADWDQEAKVIAKPINELDKEAFADMLIELGKSFKTKERYK